MIKKIIVTGALLMVMLPSLALAETTNTEPHGDKTPPPPPHHEQGQNGQTSGQQTNGNTSEHGNQNQNSNSSQDGSKMPQMTFNSQGQANGGMSQMMGIAPCRINGDTDGMKAQAYKKDAMTLMHDGQLKMRAIDHALRDATEAAEDARWTAVSAAGDDQDAISSAQSDFEDAIDTAQLTARKAKRALEKDQKAQLKALRTKYGCSVGSTQTSHTSNTSTPPSK